MVLVHQPARRCHACGRSINARNPVALMVADMVGGCKRCTKPDDDTKSDYCMAHDLPLTNGTCPACDE